MSRVNVKVPCYCSATGRNHTVGVSEVISINDRNPDSQLLSQEILFRPAKKYLAEQAFAELLVGDSDELLAGGICRDRMAYTSECPTAEFIWKDDKQGLWLALRTARNEYARRLRPLGQQGFTHLDMDCISGIWRIMLPHSDFW